MVYCFKLFKACCGLCQDYQILPCLRYERKSQYIILYDIWLLMTLPGFFFQSQLFKLMQRLGNTTPHFIRCIKPNNIQSPGVYEQGLVLQQLRCCGVLEVVRISRSGFPTRMSHQKFSRRWQCHSSLVVVQGTVQAFLHKF